MPKPIEELLAKGRCPVRLKLSPPAPSPAVEAWLAQSKWRRLQPLRISRCDKKGKRIRMRHTCWLWCYDCEAWRNPDRFVSPSEYADGERAEPRCVHGEVPKDATAPRLRRPRRCRTTTCITMTHRAGPEPVAKLPGEQGPGEQGPQLAKLAANWVRRDVRARVCVRAAFNSPKLIALRPMPAHRRKTTDILLPLRKEAHIK